MKTPENISREELIEENRHLKRLIESLKSALTKALEEVAEKHKKDGK